MVKPDRPIDKTLKFEFHFHNIRCRMLQEKNFYIMKIIFDEQEYVLTLVNSTNPKFKFDKIITKEMKFDQMETKFLEIILYHIPSTFDIYKENKIENILKKAKIYSSFKIDLLTVAVGPEFHNIILKSPSKKNEHLGRIMYTITCKQISNINVKINSVKVQMNELLQNNVAFSLKYKYKNKLISTMYSHEINPNLNQKEKITEYNYLVNDERNNPLVINMISSMFDFVSKNAYLYVYSIRLIHENSQNNNDNNDYNKGLIFENNPELKNNNNLNNNLINHYTKIGSSLLSFLEILSENDDALNKQTSQFFRHMSGFTSGKEKALKAYHQQNESQLETFTIQIYQDISRNYVTPLYYDGNEIGSCQINISINNIASIRQIMCGVLTENGFEINSIHLYDNVLSEKEESTLPKEITKLINTKRSLDNELIKKKDFQSKICQDTNLIKELLKEFKNTLNLSVEEVEYLYYGYSDKKDLLTGQDIMLDIGITLLKIIDKVNKELRSLIFDILILINERGEFDLGTLSSQWFVEKSNRKNNKVFSFSDNILLKEEIIENFFEFNYKCLEYSLAKINKGKIIEQEIKEFCIYFINIAYFRIPIFRDKFLALISTGVNEKFEEIIYRRVKGKKPNHENANIEDLLESDPINNLLLWENLFYEKLNSSLEENNKTDKIENEINEKYVKLKHLIDNNIVKEENWTEAFIQKGNIFFGLIIKLANYIIK